MSRAAEVETGPAPAEQVEAATAASVCANCGARRTTPFCGECGQSGSLHTRLRDLLRDIVQGVANLDGRLWRTLPLLMVRPGRLSRAWIEGRRASYVTPITMFLFSYFLLFLVSGFAGGFIEGILAGMAEGFSNDDVGTAFERAMAKVAQNPDLYAFKAENMAAQLAPFVALLFLPVMVLVTAGLRGYTLYDHGVVTLYGFSFLAIFQSATIASTLVGAPKPLTLALMLGAPPVHAMLHLKGAYRIGWLSALLRGLLLALFGVAGLILLLPALALLSTL